MLKKLLVVLFALFACVCQGNAQTGTPEDPFVTTQGKLKFTLRDNNYSATGELLAGKGKVDFYEVDFVNVNTGEKGVFTFAANEVRTGNTVVLLATGENVLPSPGSYDVTFVKLRASQGGFLPSEVLFSIRVEYVAPPTPTPTATVVPPTPTPVPPTPVPPTPTATPIVVPDGFVRNDLLDFSDPDSETDFGNETSFSNNGAGTSGFRGLLNRLR